MFRTWTGGCHGGLSAAEATIFSVRLCSKNDNVIKIKLGLTRRFRMSSVVHLYIQRGGGNTSRRYGWGTCYTGQG